MQRFLMKPLAVLVIAASAIITSDSTTAQDASPLPQVASPQPGPARTVRPVQKRVENLRNMILLNDPTGVKAVRKIELGRFWIGLNCADVAPALRSQLKLKEGVGLLVINAFEGSPSQKAGLKQHDIIIKADGKDIGAVGQLIEAVQKAGEAEIKLEIIREGQQQTIPVQSAERPSEQQGQVFYLPGATGEHRLIMRTPQGAFTLVEPGVVVAPNNSQMPVWKAKRNLPAGVSVTVTHKSGEEVAIHVEQNEKKWDITPDEIDQLPKELQPHVKAMLEPHHALRHMPQWFQNRANFRTPLIQKQAIELPKFKPLESRPAVAEPKPARKVTPAESEIEKLKRELSEELKQLRNAIDELIESNNQK